MWGVSADDIWVVGGRGTLLRGSRQAGFELVEGDSETSSLRSTVAVQRGASSLSVVATKGSVSRWALVSRTLTHPRVRFCFKVSGSPRKGKAWVSGAYGLVYTSDEGGPWVEVEHGLELDLQSLLNVGGSMVGSGASAETCSWAR